MASPKDIDALLDSLKLDWADLSKEIVPLLTAEAESSANDLLLRAGFTTTGAAGENSELWTRVLDRVQDEMRDRGARLVGKRMLADGRVIDNPNPEWAITETTRENLRGLLNQAIDEGWTAQKIQADIIDSESFSPARALTIARTEAAFARAKGAHIGAQEAGMKLKEWLASDEQTCEECESNAAQGQIPIDNEFDSGDDCPPAHPNCRCSCGYYNERGQ